MGPQALTASPFFLYIQYITKLINNFYRPGERYNNFDWSITDLADLEIKLSTTPVDNLLLT
jgi:hypothetical protein